ncbi:MAG: hypothetical protein ABR535_00800 [Pyrinomonadaceae bacterium]
MVREDKGVTLVDEMALMNDINAACAAATASKLPITAAQESAEQRFSKLSELKVKNLISDDEYAQRRQKIIDDI